MRPVLRALAALPGAGACIAPAAAAGLAPAAGSAGSGGSLLGGFFALLLVLALVVGLGWLVRRVGGGALRGQPGLRVVATLAVGTKERVVVVAAGDRQLLLGVTAQQVNLIQALDSPLPDVATESFAAVMARVAPRSGAVETWAQALARRLASTRAMQALGARLRALPAVQRLARRAGTSVAATSFPPGVH